MLRGIVQTGRATALSPVCASSWATARAGARARSFSGRTVKSGKVANPEAVKPAAGAGEKADNAAGGFKLEDAVKYFRRGLVVLGGSFFVFKLARDYHNPQSWLSQALYSGVSRPKYTLQIEDLKDRLAGYNTAIIAASRGPREARQFQAERMALKRLSQMSGAVEMREELAKAVLACQQLNGEITKLSIERRELMMPFHRQLLRGSKKKEGESTTDNTGESFQKALEKSAEISKQIDQKEIELSKTIIESLSPEKRQEMEARDMLPAVLNMVRTLLSSGAMDHDKSLGSIANRRRPRAYVLQFRGDIMASQVALLREEITAILTSFDVSKSDTVVIMLNSGGGTVTGYGLAAAQLQRVKDAGLKLVVCVDEVAASGGYMMAAVADEIYCSPFAVIGSIGVVSTMPNFSQRLTREGIEVEDITAGKYKRTMTPYKPSSPTDRAKVKKDIEQVLEIFKKAVVRCRPKLKDIIEEVATGEVWHGPDALERKLVDGLRIGDDILIDYLNQGADVWAISVKPAKPNSLAAALGEEPNEGGVMTGLLRQFASYLVKEIFVPAVVQNLSHQHLPEFDGEAHETYSLDSGLKAGAITGKTALAVDWSPTKR